MTKEYPLLLETIKIEDGKIYNLSYHQQRCDKSRLDLYHRNDILSLESIIQAPKHGLYRCRILYDTILKSIEYIPYQTKEIKTLKIINTSLIYNYKYANRDQINNILSMNPEVDDVIIEENNIIKDTTIANIAFYDGSKWFTPEKPLLYGTMRAKLIDEGFLETKIIKKEELHHYSQVALMNAMIGFKILKDITITNQEGNIYDY